MPFQARKYVPFFVSLAILASGMVGCGKSVNLDGTCTRQFITDYNHIGIEAGKIRFSLNAHDTRRNAENVVKACDTFLGEHGGASCRASVNGFEKKVYADDVKSDCDNIRSLLRNWKELQ